MRSQKARETAWTGMLFALAIALSYLESLVSPLLGLMPAIKLGLSNIVVMYALLFLRTRPALLLVRNLSIASLSLSVALIIANFLTVFRSQLLGDILHGILVVVSSPMICGGHWAMSLFFWACLLISSLKK